MTLARGARVVVTGASGQVGRELVAAFGDRDDVLAAGHDVLDVADRDCVLGVICGTRPETVVHAAAYTDVDGCENDPDRALRVNSLGTRHVAEACRRAGAHLLYVSTDYVFDGNGHRPYHEWDTPNPLSSYGRSKLGGEMELSPTDAVVRTSWVCGRHGRNFVKTVLKRAGAGEKLRVVDDQRGCPTFAADLADAIRRLAVARAPGTYHVTNAGAVTWYGFAREILSAAGLDPDLVEPITTAEMEPPRPAPRPRNSVLDNAALRLGGFPPMADFREPLARLVRDLAHSGMLEAP